MEAEVTAFLESFAVEAGAIATSLFRSSISVETKGDGTPVTIADRRIEELFRRAVERRFPGHGILGEEFGASASNGRYSWVVDPIDGTKSFAAGLLDWGIMVAFCIDNEPVIGLVAQPVLHEVMIGTPSGTRLNGKPVCVNEPASLSDAVLLLTSFTEYPQGAPRKQFDRLTRAVHITRDFGNCYQYLMVAAGWAHIALDPAMKPWDIKALIPIIRGAGGVITDYAGGDPNRGNSIIAAAPRTHAEVLGYLAGA